MRNSIVHTPTGNLQQSIEFYAKLNFETISETEPTLVTDGKVLVEINPDRYARAGLKIFDDEAERIVDEVRSTTFAMETERGYLLSDPNGIRVYLETEPPEVEFKQAENSFGLPGTYAGLSIESHDVQRTVAFWEAIGFSHQCGNIGDGWASYADESGMNVTIMAPAKCPHLFFNPGLTYFNSGKNLEVIQRIRNAEIPIAEEITLFNDQGLVDNVILQDPGGLGFFIFND